MNGITERGRNKPSIPGKTEFRESRQFSKFWQSSALASGLSLWALSQCNPVASQIARIDEFPGADLTMVNRQ